jgi:hypothetical protein
VSSTREVDESRLILYKGRAAMIWRGLEVDYKFQPNQIALDILEADYAAIILDARFEAITPERAGSYVGELSQTPKAKK